MAGVTRHVEDYYRATISSLSAGQRLPSERQVVRELDTCRATVRIVLIKLVAEGLIMPVHGSGYYKRASTPSTATG
jgi:DNA-binding GntR family transcriptional regulator